MRRAKRMGVAWTAALALAACGGSDGTGGHGSDAGTADAAASDAGPTDGGGAPDAGSTDAGGWIDAGGADAGAAVDGGGVCTTCIDEPLEWGRTGGFTFYEETSVIDPCHAFTLTRQYRGGPPDRTCTNDVPCAGSGVKMGDVLAALAHADVVAAFDAAPVLYGRDTRPADGQVFAIRQSGAEVLVGSPCAGGGGCTPIPAGVQDLVDLLDELTAERRAEEPCASAIPD